MLALINSLKLFARTLYPYIATLDFAIQNYIENVSNLCNVIHQNEFAMSKVMKSIGLFLKKCTVSIKDINYDKKKYSPDQRPGFPQAMSLYHISSGNPDVF